MTEVQRPQAVINGDTTTCQQCHVENCSEHVLEFDAIAGISPVVLGSTLVEPAPIVSDMLTPVPQSEEESSTLWVWPLALIGAILALGVALIWRGRTYSS